MKKWLLIFCLLAIAVLISAVVIVSLAGRTEPGSEQALEGIVTDRATGKVREEDFRARAYLSLESEDGTAQLFWFSRALERKDRFFALLRHGRGVSDAAPGDAVRIETAIEAATGLTVVTGITVLK